MKHTERLERKQLRNVFRRTQGTKTSDPSKLDGILNVYNITLQDNTLNQHSNQANIENVIHKAVGTTNFKDHTTYSDTTTSILSVYQYTYMICENTVVNRFKNSNLDGANIALGLTKKNETKKEPSAKSNKMSRASISTVMVR